MTAQSTQLPPRISKRGRVNEGRPTKYKPEYCEAILLYFDQPATRILTKTVITKQGAEIVEETEAPNKMPTIEGFANSLETTTTTVLQWSKDHREFLASYTRAKQLQHDILVENGLKGLYNPRFAQFIAVNVTGMRDKKEIAVDGEWTLTFKQLAAGEVKQKQITVTDQRQVIDIGETVDN